MTSTIFDPPPVFGGDFDYGTGPGSNPVPPDNTPLPVELFDGRTSGFGDTYYVGLFSPTKPTELDNGAKFLWGAGFDVGLDTASEDILATGRYSAGPSALFDWMQ